MTNTCFSQLTSELISKKEIKQDSLVSIDNLQNYYFIKNNAVNKKNNRFSHFYGIIKYGKISHIDTYNNLKTLLYYNKTNTVIVLDNRLGEISTIDFNKLLDFKIVSHISNANNNSFWLFNENNLRLELFDYSNLKTITKTNPITDKIIGITSDYNYAWLLTDKNILCYHYTGRLIYKIENKGYTSIKPLNENLILKKENQLYFLNKNNQELQLINLEHQVINSFFVSQQNLYIYEHKKLYTYQLNL